MISMDSTISTPSTTRGLLVIFIAGLLLLLLFVDMRRRAAEGKLQELSMRLDQAAGNQAENRESAKLIVAKVRKIYTIPDAIDPTVATIVDVAQLRKQNPF